MTAPRKPNLTEPGIPEDKGREGSGQRPVKEDDPGWFTSGCVLKGHRQRGSKWREQVRLALPAETQG